MGKSLLHEVILIKKLKNMERKNMEYIKDEKKNLKKHKKH